ncbi:hypothetical protein [Galbibacter pacificus]|uniref:DUF3299 domain-containing protein n=1 Tax=Galbibacter pacificus TaxID=2996052 RepID=A0ABT6FS95_9FLAO|nr:hypothetical protein [Galbibacter pacificus]MDG3582739.1 hypothetical protein [Galbibacter pacificus]MDG3586142.1 hypothetical protein [Galbibacter pacificus]
MKNNKILWCLLLCTFLCSAQQKVTWEDLGAVNYSEKYFSAYDSYFLYPHFEKSVKALEGKRITISGYFLNIAPDEKIYILSKSPMASCFFCGMAGPETAIELHFTFKPKFATDELVTISGILKLNADDVEHFNYILTDCKGAIVQ